MFLHLRPDHLESEGFRQMEQEVYLFFKGYVIVEGNLIEGEQFSSILYNHFLSGELPNKIGDYNGNFVFVIIQRDNIWIGNDRHGIYPLFFLQKEGQYIISTKWQRLVPFSGKELHKEAVLELLSFGYVLGEKTLVKNINEFPGASLLHISILPGRLEYRPLNYWKLEHNFRQGRIHRLESEFVSLWREQFRSYTDYIKKEGNSCIVPLSGGLDSRLLAHELDRAGIGIHAFTYGLGEQSGDVITARQVAKQLSTLRSHDVFYNDQAELQSVINSEVRYERITHARNYEKELRRYHELAGFSKIRMPGYSGDFMAGSHIRHRMRSWKSNQPLIKYIWDFHVTPMVKPGLKSNRDHMDMLINSIDQSLTTDRDPVSAFIQWDLDYRQRRYIVRPEVEDNSGPLAFLLPFFDYRYMDFFLDLPFEALLNTRLYTNAQLKYLYEENRQLIRIKRDNQKRQRMIRNNLTYEYGNKLKHVWVKFRHRHKPSLLSNWSPEIDWQKEMSAWNLPEIALDFKLHTDGANGAYILYLQSLTKLQKELSEL